MVADTYKGELKTDQVDRPLAQLGIKAAFLIWDAPRGTHRGEYLGQSLGADVRHVYITRKKGWYIAPIKYCCQAVMTLALLRRHRYQLLFVQNPPVFAVLTVYVYSLLAGNYFIIDSHTDALLAPFWRWSLPVHRFLSHRAITTIVTNDYLQQLIASWKAHTFVLRDVPSPSPMRKRVSLPDADLNVVVVSSASYDEPIEQILEAARALPDIAFFVTGNYQTKKLQDTVAKAPANVRFTGYLLDEEYYGLLDAAQVVICLTTEDHTQQSGAAEALWLGKPIITSDWSLLREYFNKGTIHTDNKADSIRRALLTMKRDLLAYEAGIRALQRTRQQEWLENVQKLINLIKQAVQ